MATSADDEREPEAQGEPRGPTSGALPHALPPELAALASGELRAMLERAREVAIIWTKSKPQADELISDLYVKLTTTRRWRKGPLLDHVLGVLRSELSHRRTSKTPVRERTAGEAYYREVRPHRVQSAEDDMLEHADAVRRQGRAADELRRLEERVAAHPLTRDVLRLKGEGVHKAAEIARALQVPTRQVYLALESLKYHLQKIRAAPPASDDTGQPRPED